MLAGFWFIEVCNVLFRLCLADGTCGKGKVELNRITALVVVDAGRKQELH